MCVYGNSKYTHSRNPSDTHRILDQSLNCACKQQTWQKWKCVFSFRLPFNCALVQARAHIQRLIQWEWVSNGLQCIALDGFPFYLNVMRTMPTKRVILIAAAAATTTTTASTATLNLSERLHLKAKIQSEKRRRKRKNAVEEISLYFSRREVNCVQLFHVVYSIFFLHSRCRSFGSLTLFADIVAVCFIKWQRRLHNGLYVTMREKKTGATKEISKREKRKMGSAESRI